MKNIGKPCAGKPHARFDEGGLVNETSSLLYPYAPIRSLDNLFKRNLAFTPREF